MLLLLIIYLCIHCYDKRATSDAYTEYNTPYNNPIGYFYTPIHICITGY